MNNFVLPRIAAALLVFSASAAAFAQYNWIDEKGTRQYSDRPPSANVPQSRILKEPGKAPGAQSGAKTLAADADDVRANTSSPSTPNAPMTTAEKNADFQRRRTEQAEKLKKAEDEKKIALARATNCERAAEYKRVLESGERIARSDRNGERAYLTDEQRARELRDTKRLISEDCK